MMMGGGTAALLLTQIDRRPINLLVLPLNSTTNEPIKIRRNYCHRMVHSVLPSTWTAALDLHRIRISVSDLRLHSIHKMTP